MRNYFCAQRLLYLLYQSKSVCVCACCCVWYIFTCASRSQRLMVSVSLSLLSTLYWGRISHLNTEMTDSCNLSVQLALGLPYLHFPSGRIAGRSAPVWHLCGYRDLNFGPHTCMASTRPTEACCPLKWKRDRFLSLGINGLELKFQVHGSLLC